MSRRVTLRGTFQELVGDETYEVWLKHATDAWTLIDTGVVALSSGHQDFVLNSLIEGDSYIAQIRLLRAGRYRLPYMSIDPGVWPVSSRVSFTTGALSTVGAPVVSDGSWVRTSAVAAHINVTATADDAALDLDIYRDGVLLQTFIGGAYGAAVSIDDDAPVGFGYVYTAKHRSGTLSGPVSNSISAFAGPPVPTVFVQTTAPTEFGNYRVTWDGAGASCRLQDDFLCPFVYTDRIVTLTENRTVVFETDPMPINPTQAASFRARVRREVTAFTVTDVSDWVTLTIACLIYEANTEYQSCP